MSGENALQRIWAAFCDPTLSEADRMALLLLIYGMAVKAENDSKNGHNP